MVIKSLTELRNLENSLENHSQTENDKERYISPERRQEIIDELRLI